MRAPLGGAIRAARGFCRVEGWGEVGGVESVGWRRRGGRWVSPQDIGSSPGINIFTDIWQVVRVFVFLVLFIFSGGCQNHKLFATMPRVAKKLNRAHKVSLQIVYCPLVRKARWPSPET